MEGLTTLDLVILGALALGAWRGFRTGGVPQLVGVAGLAVGFFAAAAWMEPAGALLVGSLGVSERIAPLAGFVLVLTAVLAASFLIGRTISAALAALRLGGVDRLLGAGLGSLRSALSVSIFLLLTAAIALPGRGPLLIGEETRAASVLYTPVVALAPAAWDLAQALAPGMRRTLQEKLEGTGGGDAG